jgi:hypothetical protein
MKDAEIQNAGNQNAGVTNQHDCDMDACLSYRGTFLLLKWLDREAKAF